MINLGENCNLDIERLIATRMLINANSGGGKSYAIRRFLERSHGQVQQIVLDLEGEFSSLREKYDYLLVGKEGEIPVSIRTAELLARKLLELNVSTVIDLSELRHPERITFVKRFLDSLVNSPKNLWHPAIIVVDEAHQFCPEKSKSESMSAVIDLMTRGRKRGFCGVLATQRISKLHKDAVAECNNQMVGRTGLDIDMKRAGDILGFTSKEDIRGLRNLKAGEFFVYGSAFEHDGVERIKVGSVDTTHPDRTMGINAMESSPTPENIKRIMKDIVDLPKEAEEELRTTADLKKKVRELKTKLTISENSKHKPEMDKDKLKEMLQQARTQASTETLKVVAQNDANYKKTIQVLEKKLSDIGRIIGQEVKPMAVTEVKPQTYTPEKVRYTPEKVRSMIGKPAQEESIRPIKELMSDQPTTEKKSLKSGAMKMLGWLAGAYPEKLTKERLATLSGFSVNGGTFKSYISALRKNEWIIGNNDLIITEEGLGSVEPVEIPSGIELLEMWKGKFKLGAGKMLQYLYEKYPSEITREELGDITGFEHSGGTFKSYLSMLKKNRLIEVNGGIKISDEFFE